MILSALLSRSLIDQLMLRIYVESTNADGYFQGLSRSFDGAKQLVEVSSNSRRARRRAIQRQNGKFVASQTRNNISISKYSKEDFGSFFQSAIALRVAVTVIDCL